MAISFTELGKKIARRIREGLFLFQLVSRKNIFNKLHNIVEREVIQKIENVLKISFDEIYLYRKNK